MPMTSLEVHVYTDQYIRVHIDMCTCSLTAQAVKDQLLDLVEEYPIETLRRPYFGHHARVSESLRERRCRAREK